MRQLRDARSQAKALESYLASLNPAYRQAAEGRRKIKDMVAVLQGAHGSRGGAAVLAKRCKETA